MKKTYTELPICDRCGNEFMTKDIEGFNSKDYCSECLEIEQILIQLKEKGSLFMIIKESEFLEIEVRPVRYIITAPFTYFNQTIKGNDFKDSFFIDGYTSKELISLLNDYIITIEPQTSDLFNIDFVLIDLDSTV